MTEAILIQQPAHAAGRLILLFHGVASTARNMVPLGRRLAAEFPDALIYSVPSPDPGDSGSGFQWFSVRGVTEDNRVPRIAATMSRFVETVQALQRSSGIGPGQTVLIGFSQGAIMALESTRLPEPPAARVVAIAGRFAQLPQRAAAGSTLHFIHGDQDPVIAHAHALAAAERLAQLGATTTIDLLPGLGHTVSPQVEDALVARLRA